MIASILPPQTDTKLHPSPPAEGVATLPELLNQAIERVTRFGPEYAGDGQKLQELRQRLAEERFHLAILGQFKRGKSTLLNALLGDDLLPTSVVPLTAMPTFIRSGPKLAVRVTYQNGRPADTLTGRSAETLTDYLAEFVTEEGNPHNQRGVAYVELLHPAPLLRRGVVLIDTPGIGSTFRHNTEATLNFLPQCDAALFLISADPPITEVEVEFLREVRSRVTRLFFILNKADYLTPAERQTTLSFLQKVLEEQIGFDRFEPIFCVSARQGIQARQSNDAELWLQSGLAEIENHLLNFLVTDKSEVLHRALAHKAYAVLTEVMLHLQLAIRSLQLPLATLEERRRLFEHKLTEAEQQRLVAGDLLAGDHKRLAAFLEEQAEQLRQEARRHLEQLVREIVAQAHPGLPDEAILQEAVAEAIPGFFEHKLGAVAQTFEQRVAGVLQPHQQRADELIETVRRGAAELFEIPYHPLAGTELFVLSHEPYWVTHQWSASLSPIPPRLIDRFLPISARRARVTDRLNQQIKTLVIRNVENLRWATLQNLDQAFRRFNTTLEQRLQETVAATQGAIQAASLKRREQGETIAETVAELEAAVREFEGMLAALQRLFNS